MAMLERWLVAIIAAFLLFPVAFVLWQGADADFGFFGGILMMMFVQFLSPYALWRIPLGAGTVAALLWHILAERRAIRWQASHDFQSVE